MGNGLETIVLRFSDFQSKRIDTIKEHEDILSDYGKVYWGLWQKPYESLIFNEETANWEYRKDGIFIGEISFPKNIWLCNISAKKVYVARCTEIKSANDIDNEERVFVPNYYNDSEVEYFFSLTSIIERDYVSFHSKNKSILDFSSNDTILTELGQKSGNEYIVLKGNSILHISDLHFGENCNYIEGSNEQNPRKFAYKKSLLEKFNNIKDVGLIVASGDFANGKERRDVNLNKQNFAAASNFLKNLCKLFNLDPKRHLIVVPGNHDKGFFEDYFDPVTGKMNNDYDQDYRNFQKDLINIDKFTYTRKYIFPNGIKIKILCIDSSDLQSSQIREYGYVDMRQFESPEIDNNDDLCIKIAVMHYPLVIPPSKIDINSYVDSDGNFHAEALSVLENSFEIAQVLTEKRFKYLLHGHQHYPYVGRYCVRKSCEGKEGNIGFICAGTLGLNHTDTTCLYEDFLFNSFNIYSIRENKLNVKVYKFIPSQEASIVDECTLDI